MERHVVWLAAGVVVASTAFIAVLLSFRGTGPQLTAAQRKVPALAVPIGVLGDSDSVSYQGSDDAGGPFNESRLQWTEVLVRLRGLQVDLGEWGDWGIPRWMSMTRLRDGLKQRWRGPARTDYRHDLAWSSSCRFLLEGGWRQAERLRDIMDEEPQRWTRGVVVIRMGINDFGKESLDILRSDPAAAEVRARMDACLAYIGRAVDFIHERHPTTRFVLVGIFDNAHWPAYFAKFQDPQELANISRGLDYFDDALRAKAARDPRLAFFDDRAWFDRYWGGRDAQGRPAYRTVTLGKLSVTNSEGDDPRNAGLASGHAGLMWNTLWVQSLVDLMRSAFDVPVDPVSAGEAAGFIDARVS